MVNGGLCTNIFRSLPARVPLWIDMNRPEIRFQRANYVVANLDRALEFYVGVLGLTLDFVKESDKTSFSYPVFAIPDDAVIRFAVLSAPNQPRVMALTEIKNIELKPVSQARQAAIELESPDSDVDANRTKAAGFEVCEEGKLETLTADWVASLGYLTRTKI